MYIGNSCWYSYVTPSIWTFLPYRRNLYYCFVSLSFLQLFNRYNQQITCCLLRELLFNLNLAWKKRRQRAIDTHSPLNKYRHNIHITRIPAGFFLVLLFDPEDGGDMFSVDFYLTIRCYMLVDRTLHSQRCKILKLNFWILLAVSYGAFEVKISYLLKYSTLLFGLIIKVAYKNRRGNLAHAY
jgi:hypothetical protein